MGQKKGSVPVNDPSGLKIGTNNMMGKPPPPSSQGPSQPQIMRTPQNQGQTRLMPSSVNNFST